MSQEDFRGFLNEIGLSRRTVQFKCDLVTRPVSRFIWDQNIVEEAQGHEYTKWLYNNISLPKGCQFYPASSDNNLLTADIFGYLIKGTSDTVIDDSAYVADNNIPGGILVFIAKKKHVEKKDPREAILELITVEIGI